MSELVERLGEEANVGDRVGVTLSDGTAFEGAANPIDYVPEESLRVEIRPEDGSTDRYELSATYEDGWTDLTVRHTDAADDEAGWEDLGAVESVEVGDEWNWGTSSGS